MKACQAFRNQVHIVKILDFTYFDDLADCAAMLYQRYGRLKSCLYKMPKHYRLVIAVKEYADLACCSEFGKLQNGTAVATAYTEEYGELLIDNHAVQKIGSAFAKHLKVVSKI